MIRIKRKTVVLCIAIGTTTFFVGCFRSFLVTQSRVSRDASAILDETSDLEFVGSGAFSDELSVPAHGMNRQALPTKLEAARRTSFITVVLTLSPRVITQSETRRQRLT